MAGGRDILRRPLVPAAALYAAGSAIGRHIPASAAIAAAIVLAAAVATAVIWRRGRAALLLVAMFALAALRGAIVCGAAAAAGRDFARFTDSDEPVALRGEVSAVLRGEAASRGDWRHRFRLRGASFRDLRGPWRHLHGEILVEWYSMPPEKGGRAPARGDSVEILGIVHARRHLPATPTADDVRLVSGATRTRILRRRGDCGAISRFRRDAAKTLSRGLGRHPRERELILAMTLGLRSEVARETLDSFRRAGTIHVFAISGLHVGAMALMIVALLSLVGVPRTFVVLPLAPLLAAYIYMTGMQPSAIRAALMVCIHYFALLVGRRPDGLGSVALALLAILVAHPEAIAETSLVMSFTMVTGILLFAGPVAALCRRALPAGRRAAPDPPAALAPGGYAGFLLSRARDKAVSLFSAALCASLVSFPLTAHMLHCFAPYSILANIVVVPLTFPLMAIAGAGLLLSAAIPGVEFVTNNMAMCVAWVVCRVSAGVAALPHASFRGDFPLWALLLWYAALFLVLRVMPRRMAGQPGDPPFH